MTTYKEIVGQKITKVSSDPSEAKTGQMWYNSTDGKLRALGLVEAFSSASPIITAATVASNVTLTLPADDGDADQALVTNGSGVLSWTTISGGADWQAVKTSATFTAVAGQGYFINTTSNPIEMDLPAGSIGDEIAFIDYAGTFDTNALTIDPNGTEKIAGSTASLTVSTERAANTLVYVDSTQGWLLKNN